MDIMANVQALIKQAQEAGTSAQGNLAIEPTAAMAAQQTQVDALAKQSGGTVEQQQNESLQKGLATQVAAAGPDDKVEANMLKAAALVELVDSGLDFYDAFEKVAYADMELQKEAAFNELMEAGYGFEDAVALVQAAAQ